LSVVTKALDTATKQLYEVREELSIEKAAHKDTQGRYQQALGSSRSHQGMIASLNQNIEVLQESLSLEKAKSESLTLQLTELQEKYDVSFKARENIDLGSNSQDAIAESSITESSNLKLSQLQQQLNLMQQRMTESTALFRSQVEAANLATSSAASRVSDLESEVLELHAQLATKKTELESMNCVINAGNKEIAELIAQVAAANEKNELDTKKISSEKDERIAELTSKLASLTEKAKDYVKKYSDAKQQIANLETSNTKLASDLAASNQTKVVK
jgi:chromosome segregation ATPase